MVANWMLHFILSVVLKQEKVYQDGFKPESNGVPSKLASH